MQYKLEMCSQFVLPVRSYYLSCHIKNSTENSDHIYWFKVFEHYTSRACVVHGNIKHSSTLFLYTGILILVISKNIYNHYVPNVVSSFQTRIYCTCIGQESGKGETSMDNIYLLNSRIQHTLSTYRWNDLEMTQI